MKKLNEKILIDGLDKIILKALMDDARKSINEIAKTAGISGAAVHQRLKKLESVGLISSNLILLPNSPQACSYFQDAISMLV